MASRAPRSLRRPLVAFAVALTAGALLAPATGASSGDAGSGAKAKPQPSFLFAHSARSAMFAPIPGQPRHYRLTLAGVQREAVYFTDRPYRLAGAVPLGRMLKGLFHGPQPLLPNAAVSAVDPSTGKQVLMGVELVAAAYDWKQRVLVYTVKRLREGPAATRSDGRTDPLLPAKLAETTVFIDDCDACQYLPDGTYVPFDTSF